jgi:hypothetical protein
MHRTGWPLSQECRGVYAPLPGLSKPPGAASCVRDVRSEADGARPFGRAARKGGEPVRLTFRITDAETLIDPAVLAPDAPPGTEARLCDGRVAYHSLLASETPAPAPWLNSPDDPPIRDHHRWWQQLHESRPFLPQGFLELRDALVVGHWSLVLDRHSGLCLTGPAFNWWDQQVRAYLEGTLPADWGLRFSEDGREFSFELPADTPEETQPLLLLGSPGVESYGHWLLDHVPRLALAELLPLPADAPMLLPQMHPFIPPLLEAFDVAPGRVAVRPFAPLRRVRRAWMVSGTRNGFRVSGPVCRIAWRRLRAAMLPAAPEPDEPPAAERVFVSRQGWASSWGEARAIGNAERLEALCAARGYSVVHPQRHGIPAQARAFAAARVVVGEDGSGLHNVLFSGAGAALGVISTPERLNLWHAAICEELGHQLGFIVSTPRGENAQRMVDEAKFCDWLDRLEAAAR